MWFGDGVLSARPREYKHSTLLHASWLLHSHSRMSPSTCVQSYPCERKTMWQRRVAYNVSRLWFVFEYVCLCCLVRLLQEGGYTDPLRTTAGAPEASSPRDWGVDEESERRDLGEDGWLSTGGEVEERGIRRSRQWTDGADYQSVLGDGETEPERLGGGRKERLTVKKKESEDVVRVKKTNR